MDDQHPNVVSEIERLQSELAAANADAERGWHWATSFDRTREPARYVEWHDADLAAHRARVGGDR